MLSRGYAFFLVLVMVMVISRGGGGKVSRVMFLSLVVMVLSCGYAIFS